jgi:hypothetical protein
MAPPFAAIRISPPTIAAQTVRRAALWSVLGTDLANFILAKPLRGLQGRAIPASTPILTLLEQRRDSDKAGVSFAHKKEDRLDWGF